MKNGVSSKFTLGAAKLLKTRLHGQVTGDAITVFLV
jgi:hypothetical protein